MPQLMRWHNAVRRSMLVFCTLLAILATLEAGQSTPRVERLPNGLRVAIVEEHALPLVSVQLWYRVGSGRDVPTQPGLCHVARTVLEHRDDAALKLRAAGVRFESRTLRDACNFSSLLPPNFLEYVLEIEARRMRPLAVTAEMVAEGLGAAARDYGLEPDDPEKLAERELLAAMFPGHPYQHPPGFVAESLKDLTTTEVQEFFDRWFVVGNATLFIIGDVSTPVAMELVRKHFGPLGWAEPPRRSEPPRIEDETVRLELHGRDRPELVIAWRTPPMGYFENAAIDVLMQRLCNPVDGPLCERLLERGCGPPRWQREAWREAGMLVLSIDVVGRGDRVGLSARASVGFDELERIVCEELAGAAETIPTEIAHNRARALAMRDVRNRLAAFGDRARILAAHEIVAGDLLIAEFELPRLERVAVADVQQAAVALQSARAVAAEARKPPTDGHATPAEPGLPRELPASLPATLPARLDPADALALLGQHATDAPDLRTPPRPPVTKRHALDSGVTVTVCAVSALEPVEVRTLVQPRCLMAMSALMAVGSAQHTVDEVRDYLSYHGCDLFTHDSGLHVGLVSRAPTSSVGQMVELHAELIRRPRRDGSGQEGQRQMARLRQQHVWYAPPESERYLPPHLIGWHAHDVVFGSRSAGDPIDSNLNSLDGIWAVDILVVGDVDEKQVLRAVEWVWADWTPADSAHREGKRRAQQQAQLPAPTVPEPPPTRPLLLPISDGRRALTVRDYLVAHTVRQPHRNFGLSVARWLFGPRELVSTTLDGQRTWTWTWSTAAGAGIEFNASPAPPAWERTLKACVARMERVRRGKIPRNELETALRQARADCLLSLDEAWAIADTIEMGIRDPWDLLVDLEPEDIPALLRGVWCARARAIDVHGPEEWESNLEGFAVGHDTPASRPNSP